MSVQAHFQGRDHHQHPDLPAASEHLSSFVLAVGSGESILKAPSAEDFFEHPTHEEEGPRFFPPLIVEDNLRSVL